MAEPNDQQWLDALAGRAGGQAPSPDAREAEALRKAILATRGEHETADHDVEVGVQRLLFRLRREGLADTPQKKSWRTWGTFAMAAMLMLAIGVVVLQAPQDIDVPVYRGGGAQTLRVPDAAERAATLTRELEALNIQPKVTRFGNNLTIQAEWPAKPGAQHAAFLKRQSLQQPASGPLVIELLPSAGK